MGSLRARSINSKSDRAFSNLQPDLSCGGDIWNFDHHWRHILVGRHRRSAGFLCGMVGDKCRLWLCCTSGNRSAHRAAVLCQKAALEWGATCPCPRQSTHHSACGVANENLPCLSNVRTPRRRRSRDFKQTCCAQSVAAARCRGFGAWSGHSKKLRPGRTSNRCPLPTGSGELSQFLSAGARASGRREANQNSMAPAQCHWRG